MMRTKTIGSLAALAAALMLTAAPATAQDDDEAGPITWGDDAKYLRVSYVKYKPGKRERAMQIIDEHFAKAAAAAGRPGPVMVIHFQSGEWDALWAWELEGGTADLQWYRSPGSVDWWNALVKQEGGEDKANALMEEYVGSIKDSLNEIGHHHPPAK